MAATVAQHSSGLLTQFGEGVSFLSERHLSAWNAPHFTLADLAKLDSRLDAHLDGLRVAGEDGWQACKEGIANGDVFAPAVLAFESNHREHIQAVLGADQDQLAAALHWLLWEQAQVHLANLTPYLASAASASHRQNPGEPLAQALNSANTLTRARALQALGELGIRIHFHEHLSDPDANCRYWAAWSATLVGESNAIDTLRSIAEAGGLHDKQAADLAARRMRRNEALAWHQQITNLRTKARIAQGLADPELIPWLIELMNNPEHSRVAGEAFSMITGADIAYLDLDLKEPPVPVSDEPPPDATAPPDEDVDLPWPDPKIIEKWWSKYRSNFQPGIRYVLGKPIDDESTMHALKFGYQRQRAAAALEQVFLHPGQPLFDVTAPGFRQMRQLGLQRKDFRRGSPQW